jgi:hypothetical protein
MDRVGFEPTTSASLFQRNSLGLYDFLSREQNC